MQAEADLSGLVQRSHDAKQLLEHPLFVESLKILKQAYMDQAAKCGEKDDLGRFRFLEGYKMVSTHETFLRAIVETGSVAQSELDALMAERGVKRFIPKF